MTRPLRPGEKADIPAGVRELLLRGGPLHILVGNIPVGWQDFTLTNASDRGTIGAFVSNIVTATEQLITITLHVPLPGERGRSLPFPGPLMLGKADSITPQRRLPAKINVFYWDVVEHPHTGTHHLLRDTHNRRAACGYFLLAPNEWIKKRDGSIDRFCERCVQHHRRAFPL